MARWQSRGEGVPAELLDLVRPIMGNGGSRTAAQWLELMDTTSAATELMSDDGLSLARLRAFRFPILAMYGDNSQARLSGAELLDVWPHAEFRRVRDAGHFFPVSRPDDVISACRRFWNGEFAQAERRNRAGEARRSHFRSDRIFRVDGAWYFATRETKRVGPFAEYEEARRALSRQIEATCQ